ncbi:MAG TPA: NAD(P)H-binding protein [Thermoanaerobaculia bacterium]|nr:NAD(P)H-binding protein [Thermoanaerobaculia bacterium]
MPEPRHVFVTGGTGYMGSRVIPELLRRGHRVSALVREGSSSKLPDGCGRVVGNALDERTFTDLVAPADTLLHLVGVAHPSPAKAAEFRSVDLASARASAKAAAAARVSHFVYVSVAQPAPVMKAYVEARAEGEVAIRATGIPATFLRPWYVLGPGHRWPSLFLPVYRLLQLLPPTRDTATRLYPVTLQQMIAALVGAVENPASGVRVVEAAQIRGARLEA